MDKSKPPVWDPGAVRTRSSPRSSPRRLRSHPPVASSSSVWDQSTAVTWSCSVARTRAKPTPDPPDLTGYNKLVPEFFFWTSILVVENPPNQKRNGEKGHQLLGDLAHPSAFSAWMGPQNPSPQRYRERELGPTPLQLGEAVSPESF